MNNHARGRTLSCIAALSVTAATLLISESALAQERLPESGPIDQASTDEGDGDIVVTAQRREQRLQDVGIAISALGGERLAELGVTNSLDIISQVPGLQVSANGGGTTSGFNIRGVTQNAFAGPLESPIAVYLDESYLALNTTIGLSLFDIDRVEVLRGPQGTLFGRNATGGLVRYITNKPSDRSEGFVNLQVGENARIRAEAATGGGLTDTLSGRISGVFNYNEGIIKNDIGPDSMRVKDWGVRGQLRYQPSEDIDVLLKAQYLHEDDNRGGYNHVVSRGGQYLSDPAATDFFGYRDADGNPFTGSFDFPGYKKTKVTDLTGTIDWTLGDFTLSSITNYQHVSDNYGEDSDMSPLSVYNYVKVATVDQFSQELRLGYERDGVNALIGAYYLLIDGLYGTRQSGDFYFGSAVEVADIKQKTQTFAIFAQSDFRVIDKVNLVLGLRYSRDTKDFHYTTTNVFDFFQPGPVNVNDRLVDDGISAKAQLNYRPNDRMLFYVGINRGIKSGGFNFPLFPYDPTLLPFKGETLTAYESGVKISFDRATTLNLSAFYYDYNGYQAFSYDGLAARVLNVNAEMYGGEIELQAEPFDGLDLTLGGSWLENTVRDVPLNTAVGNQKAAISPRFTVNGVLRYSWAGMGGILSAQIDGNWRDSVNFNLVPTPVLREGPITLLNARLGYRPSATPLDFAVFVRNLTDRQYRAYSLDTSGDFGSIEDTPGVPRWFGASVGYRW